jgi:phosphotransferase system HPr-like phosphotransfer protein
MNSHVKQTSDIINGRKVAIYTAEVSIPSVQAVKEFVELNSRVHFDVDVGSDRFIIDGKSIMGLFSLNLSKPVTVSVQGEDKSPLEDYMTSIDKFIV